MSTFTAASKKVADLSQTRKSFWETLFSSIPVGMTVLATVLAGMSSSEMTQAQYHRALAAQLQSKVGDQWGYFQAKRIRGTILEKAIDLFPGGADPAKVKLPVLQAALEGIADDCQRMGQAADRMREAISAAGSDLGAHEQLLQTAADQLAREANEVSPGGENLASRITAALNPADAELALHYHLGGPTPRRDSTPAEEPAIREALNAIEARKPEQEMAPVLVRIHGTQLEEAIDEADARAKHYSSASEPIARSFAPVEESIKARVQQSQMVQHAARGLTRALAGLPEADGKAMARLHAVGTAVARVADDLHTDTEELSSDLKSARDDFSARRYRSEAEDNGYIAGLYEIKVHKSSLQSDRHRLRSMYFFYGMLAAQAGVTIGTLALAVRNRSMLLGSLSGLAGLVGLAIGVYVWWTM